MRFFQSRPSILTYEGFKSRWLLVALWAIAISMGALHAWVAATNYSMNADGISYLDIGDAYYHGDWGTAINAIWSPLYSWVLGAAMATTNPSMAWEFPLVHIVNFFLYLLTLVCFSYFWHQLSRLRKVRLESNSGTMIGLPDWVWIPSGYLLFIWTSLFLIEIWAVTPDMLMAAFVYLAAGLVISIRLGEGTWGRLFLLGTVLGFGYLAKTIMWPLGFVFIGSALLSFGSLRMAWPRVLLALVVFLAISGVFIGAISLANGRLTYGEAGSLVYVRHVNGIPYPHWQGEPEGFGTPIHPTRQVIDTPPIYEFGSPIGGTYPVSLNPQYWYEGVEVEFDFARQFQALMQSGIFYFDLFVRRLGVVIAGLLIIYILGWRRPQSITHWARNWAVALPAIAAFVLYAPVLVAGRYIGVFVSLLLGICLANVLVPAKLFNRRLLTLVSTILLVFLILNLAVANLEGFMDLTLTPVEVTAQVKTYETPGWPGEVTEALQSSGLQEGDQVAVIGYAFDSYWARLGRFKIVAEMLGTDADEFWFGSEDQQRRAIRAFADTGAKAIVAENVPEHVDLPDWEQIGATDHFIYLLAPQER